MNTPTASRDAGLSRLAECAPLTGAVYTEWRNTDLGPTGENRVTKLSPWLRHRLLLEPEVIDAAAAQHGLDGAEKFIQEVCWRAYWKGFLERRPVHWYDYVTARQTQRTNHQRFRDQSQQLERAEAGQTGIECFDAWVDELTTYNYLHNHARMWFASIWVFTLGLPWALGADFFLRHLLDGDPASNTLSWRWIAGYHTPGKTYLARPNNIERHTQGRFTPGPELATEAPAPEGIERPALGPAPLPVAWQCDERTGLLITEDDLTPESLFGAQPWAASVAVQATQSRSEAPVSHAVTAFAHAGLGDALARNPANSQLGPLAINTEAERAAAVERIRASSVDQLLSAWVPTGPTADAVEALRVALNAENIALKTVPRDWDIAVWPHSTHGFFRFWKAVGPWLAERQAAGA